jgi:hypothetical protein
MDLVLAITGPTLAFIGASAFALLFVAFLIGTLAASVFVAIFYAANKMGKAISRARSAAGS